VVRVGDEPERRGRSDSDSDKKLGEPVDTVDKITEGKWCDHVGAHGYWSEGTVPIIVVAVPGAHIVIEEGVVKILCFRCLQQALAVRENFLQPPHRIH
jgi:hypothetical protein